MSGPTSAESTTAGPVAGRNSSAGRNPFVGPRPLARGETLYGREREVTDLTFLLRAERVVLLHAPSGAGKSSLVHAGLLPRLDAAFDVWSPTRVNLEPPAGFAGNRYVLSAAVGFEQDLPERHRRGPEALGAQSLEEYVHARPQKLSAPPRRLLIFDQFEEVLTADPVAIEAKQAFFDQLGETLRDPQIWALLVLREDYLAQLDPYARRVPTHLENRFRIDRLGLDDAREVMVETARDGGRKFPAAQRLVRDLATMNVQQPDGSFVRQKGRHVEPVQLQVVCRRLWAGMPADDRSIDPEDVKKLADVDRALGAYYDDSVARAAGDDVAVERGVREWFGERLITAGGIRGQVLMESEASGGLANELIARLRDSHLIRAEQRSGATWYELAHDRLIEPVRESNAAWREEHLSEVQQRAALWEKQDHTPGLLMKDEELTKGEHWARQNDAGLTEVERRFLKESRKAQDAADRARRQARWIKGLAVVSLIVAVLAVWQWTKANSALKRVVETLQKQLTSDDPETVFAAVDRLLEDHEKEPGEVVGWIPEARFESNRGFAELSWGLGRAAAQRDRRLTLEVRPALIARFTKARGLAQPPSWQDDEELNPRIAIRADRFRMGSPEGEGDDDERPQHLVELSAFAIQEHEVTNREYRRFEPDHALDAPGQLPVVDVSWYDAMAYAAWLGGRLPTEAEWEYAARAGTTSRYWSGDDEEDLARVGWYGGNSGDRLHEVKEKGEKGRNPWGLYDVHGNAWEWVADWYGPYLDDEQQDPWGPPSGVSRVFRGGSYWDSARSARAALRDRVPPGLEGVDLGFRVVLPGAPSR